MLKFLDMYFRDMIRFQYLVPPENQMNIWL